MCDYRTKVLHAASAYHASRMLLQVDCKLPQLRQLMWPTEL